MDDYGCVWNFEQLPESTGLQVERFISPNPIPKAVRATIVGLNGSMDVRFWRFAGLAMARKNQRQAESQKTNGGRSPPPLPDVASHLATEQPMQRTGPVFAQAHVWN